MGSRCDPKAAEDAEEAPAEGDEAAKESTKPDAPLTAEEAPGHRRSYREQMEPSWNPSTTTSRHH